MKFHLVLSCEYIILFIVFLIEHVIWKEKCELMRENYSCIATHDHD